MDPTHGWNPPRRQPAVCQAVCLPQPSAVQRALPPQPLMHACMLFCPAVAGLEELPGQLVCFKFCPIIKRDFAVVLAAHQHDQQQQQQGDVLEKQHQQQEGGGSHSLNSSAQKVGRPAVHSRGARGGYLHGRVSLVALGCAGGCCACKDCSKPSCPGVAQYRRPGYRTRSLLMWCTTLCVYVCVCAGRHPASPAVSDVGPQSVH